MKKISNILLAVTFALPLFTACETDNDSNPILNEPDTFTLNTPAYAANNVYDLKNAQTVELTCSQPDYGFPAATTYTVQQRSMWMLPNSTMRFSTCGRP